MRESALYIAAGRAQPRINDRYVGGRVNRESFGPVFPSRIDFVIPRSVQPRSPQIDPGSYASRTKPEILFIFELRRQPGNFSARVYCRDGPPPKNQIKRLVRLFRMHFNHQRVRRPCVKFPLDPIELRRCRLKTCLHKTADQAVPSSAPASAPASNMPTITPIGPDASLTASPV
jgi:hypothetical protein